jgi:hypothetical protein
MQIISRHLYPYPEQFKRIQEKMWQNATTNIAESKSQNNGVIAFPRFSLSRSHFTHLPGDIVYFISNLPKLPKEIVNYMTDNSLSSTAHFGPPPPRRVVSIKVRFVLIKCLHIFTCFNVFPSFL